MNFAEKSERLIQKMSECFVFLLLTFIFPALLNLARAIHQSQPRVFTFFDNSTILRTLLSKKNNTSYQNGKEMPTSTHEWYICSGACTVSSFLEMCTWVPKQTWKKDGGESTRLCCREYSATSIMSLLLSPKHKKFGLKADLELSSGHLLFG